MKAWDRVRAAIEFEQVIDRHVENLILPSPNQLRRLLDQYLRDLSDKRLINGKPPAFKTYYDKYRNVILDLGHSNNETSESGMLKFSRGAKLGFIVTLQETSDGSRLLAASFNLLLPPTAGINFVRIHLEADTPADPLQKSRCHLHPGFQQVHVPFPIMEPRATLDRLVFELIPKFSQ